MEVVFPITAVQGDSACADITILDDDTPECSHKFTVSINDATLNTDIMGTNEAVIRIVDNDHSKWECSLYQKSTM